MKEPVKIKTLLFGAGYAAKKIIANTKDKRDFIAILDNSSEKNGTYLENIAIFLPSIFFAADSKKNTFDEIVIATQYVDDVKRQLTQNFGISPEKIIILPKSQMKNYRPFENVNSIALAREIIFNISSLAIKNKFKLAVDFGTLLGIVRDGDIISWDDDIDFAAPAGSEKMAEILCKTFIDNCQHPLNWQIEKTVNTKGVCVCISLKFDNIISEQDQSTDIKDNDRDNNSQKLNYTPFTTCISFRENINGKSLHLPSIGLWYSPDKHFLQLEEFQWQGHCILVPYKYENYLSFQYGDWRTPKTNFQANDYAHIQNITFAQIEAEGMKDISIYNSGEK